MSTTDTAMLRAVMVAVEGTSKSKSVFEMTDAIILQSEFVIISYDAHRFDDATL